MRRSRPKKTWNDCGRSSGSATSSRYRRCICPIHVYGTLGGEKIRRALDLNSWEAAYFFWTGKGLNSFAAGSLPANLESSRQKFPPSGKPSRNSSTTWNTGSTGSRPRSRNLAGRAGPSGPSVDCATSSLDEPSRQTSPAVVRGEGVSTPEAAGRRCDTGIPVRLARCAGHGPKKPGTTTARGRSSGSATAPSSWVKTNPAVAVKAPQIGNPSERVKTFGEEQLASLLVACDQYPTSDCLVKCAITRHSIGGVGNATPTAMTIPLAFERLFSRSGTPVCASGIALVCARNILMMTAFFRRRGGVGEGSTPLQVFCKRMAGRQRPVSRSMCPYQKWSLKPWKRSRTAVSISFGQARGSGSPPSPIGNARCDESSSTPMQIKPSNCSNGWTSPHVPAYLRDRPPHEWCPHRRCGYSAWPHDTSCYRKILCTLDDRIAADVKARRERLEERVRGVWA